jgi:protein gp37
MGDRTRIEWTRADDGTPGATWNPVAGCYRISPGCDHCYAEAIASRFAGTTAYPNGFAVTLHPDRLTQPLRWARPRRIFVNSMSDLFHPAVPDEYIASVFAVMAATPRHTYLVLTKRHGRMRSLLRDVCRCGAGHRPGEHFRAAMSWAATAHNPEGVPGLSGHEVYHRVPWPLPNVWLGISAEDQRWWDVRVPALLEIPAAIRFVSAEPLLGPIRLTGISQLSRPDWIIAGGESGPRARPMDPQWVRDLRDDAVRNQVPFFFKQWGGLHAKANGRELDGRLWDQMPTPVGGPS